MFVDAGGGDKKFGDRCESSSECGVIGGYCDPSKKTCQCNPELQVTNHIDRCGKGEFLSVLISISSKARHSRHWRRVCVHSCRNGTECTCPWSSKAAATQYVCIRLRFLSRCGALAACELIKQRRKKVSFFCFLGDTRVRHFSFLSFLFVWSARCDPRQYKYCTGRNGVCKVLCSSRVGKLLGIRWLTIDLKGVTDIKSMFSLSVGRDGLK